MVTFLSAVLMLATGIKVRSRGQAIKLEMIKRSRRPFTLLKSRSRRLLSFDSTHTSLTPIGNQGSKLFSGAIKRLRSKNGPDEILIPVVGVSTPGLLCDHPLIVHCREKVCIVT